MSDRSQSLLKGSRLLQSPSHYRPVIQYARYSSRLVTPACQSLHQLASRYSRSLRSLRSALQTFLSLRDSRCDMYACVTALLQYEVRPTKVRLLHIINTTRRSERGSREEIGIAKFKHQFKSTCEESYYMLEGYAQIWLSIASAVAVAADAAAGSQNGRFLIRIELKINENGQPGLQNGGFLIRI